VRQENHASNWLEPLVVGMTAARCLVCNIWIAPFGGADIAALVLEHLKTHRRPPAAPVPVGAA